MKKAVVPLLLVVACLPVVWMLFRPGFYNTHDGEFNLVRLMHFSQELAWGQFPVRWASGLNFGFGSPVFNFFYPLMYYLGSLVHLAGIDYTASLKIVIGLATVGSVLAFYAWLRRFFERLPAFFGSLVFLFWPFRLLTLYVTGSFGMLLSLFFLPLALWAFEVSRKNGLGYSVLAICLAGIMLSYNVGVVMLAPLLLAYVAWRYWRLGRKDYRRLVLSLVFGFGLSFFFIYPALAEIQDVHLAEGVVVNFAEHFPTLKQLLYSPWGYGYSNPGANDGMSFQVGAVQLLAVAGAFLVLLKLTALKHKWAEIDRTAVFFLAVFGLSFGMMLSVSTFLWKALPVIAQIQFPWRILAVSGMCAAFLAGYLVKKVDKKIFPLALMLLLFWANRNYLRTWEMRRYSDSDYAARPGLLYGSTDIAGETRPIWVTENPGWFADALAPAVNISGISTATKAGEIEAVFAAREKTLVTLNKFYFPGEIVLLDGQPVHFSPTPKTGLVQFEATRGEHRLQFWRQETATETQANIVSLVSLIALAGFRPN